MQSRDLGKLPMGNATFLQPILGARCYVGGFSSLRLEEFADILEQTEQVIGVAG
jgi:hypothetical protein